MRPVRLLLGLPAPVRLSQAPRHGRWGATILVALALTLAPWIAASAAPAPASPSGAPAPPPGVHLPPPPGTTLRASVSGSGLEGLGASLDAAISADGRWVAFASAAGNLVGGDTNGAPDIFVRDLAAGTTTRIPIIGGGPVPPGGLVLEPSISEDGEFVAFTFTPPQVGTIAAPPPRRVLLWQRSTNATVTVSVDPAGQPVGPSYEPSVSPDGTWVAYTSEWESSNIHDVPRIPDVYAWNRLTGQTVRVSVPRTTEFDWGGGSSPSISRAGAFVAFQSTSMGLAGEADNNPNGPDVFVRDMAAGTTRLVTSVPASPPGTTTPPRIDSIAPVISGDGAFVAFDSTARFVPEDTNSVSDVYRWQRATAAFDLVSVGVTGVAASGGSGQAAISGDGRYVAFASTAGDVVPAALAGESTGAPRGQLAAIRGNAEIYLRDLSVPETIRISVTTDGGSAGAALRPAVSDDGGRVSFDTANANLVANDGNRAHDVFVRDLPAIPTVAPNPVEFGGQPVGVEGPPSAVTVGNQGWADLRVASIAILGPHASDFDVAADPCSAARIRRGGACTITLTFRPSGAGERFGELRISDSAPGSPRSVGLRGTASDAILEVDPLRGPPGRVVIATGAGFPPGATVRLAWQSGIDPRVPPVVADESGAFRVQVLVFHKDTLGPRLLRAESVAGPSFPPIDAEYVVTQPLARPPAYNTPFRIGPDPIIIRR